MRPGKNSCRNSPGAGSRPDPTRDAFKRPQRTCRSYIPADYCYYFEEGNFYFSEVKALPLRNRFVHLPDNAEDTFNYNYDFISDYKLNEEENVKNLVNFDEDLNLCLNDIIR